jgi:lactate racemase
MSVIGDGLNEGSLSEARIEELMAEALEAQSLAGKRVLILIPDATRTAPIPLMFRLFRKLLSHRVAALDYLVALGTHQPMADDALSRLVGEPVVNGRVGDSWVFNHRWDIADTFTTLGVIAADRIAEITGGLMSMDVPVTVNRLVLEYDNVFICGPTFPHEVIGFSGGNKYFFPGISGPEVINFTHWLGAVITSYEVIGTPYTPVRKVVDIAAQMVDRPKLCFSMVVRPAGDEEGQLAGLFIGSPEDAYTAAADLSSRTHIVWVDAPFNRVLSIIPPMYDEIWTAAKGMYKMEPAIADDGEVVIYAPHIDEISYTHGKIIDEVGYHVRDYFLKQWDRFSGFPWGVLAHSTHLRGMGTYEDGREAARIKVTLATQIPRDRVERVSLSYLDPAAVDINWWLKQKDEGVLVVPKAGEMLYRVRDRSVPKRETRR